MRAQILLVGLAVLVYASALASAGDVGSAEAQGELGVGPEDAGEMRDAGNSHVDDVQPGTSSTGPFQLEILYVLLAAECVLAFLCGVRG